MKTLLIIYHSQSGTCEALTRAAWQGATTDDDIKVVVKRSCDATSADLLHVHGLLLAAAENSGYLAGGMKEFLDRVFYPLQQARLLPAGLLISAGNDGRNAERQLLRILAGMPVKMVVAPLIIRGQPTPVDVDACVELGATLAAGLSLGIF